VIVMEAFNPDVNWTKPRPIILLALFDIGKIIGSAAHKRNGSVRRRYTY